MGRIFGTDGVRGLANRDLTAELALDLSVAAAHVLGEHVAEGHAPDPVGAEQPSHASPQTCREAAPRMGNRLGGDD